MKIIFIPYNNVLRAITLGLCKRKCFESFTYVTDKPLIICFCSLHKGQRHRHGWVDDYDLLHHAYVNLVTQPSCLITSGGGQTSWPHECRQAGLRNLSHYQFIPFTRLNTSQKDRRTARRSVLQDMKSEWGNLVA